jgi:hypothetical protein
VRIVSPENAKRVIFSQQMTDMALSASQYEIWLRGNRRALVVGSVLPAVFGVIGFIGAMDLLSLDLSLPMRLAAAILTILSALVALTMANQARLPRLAHADGQLLVFTGPSRPDRVPVDVVEVFFGGQDGTDVHVHVPGHKVESRNVVVRLAERHKQWHQRKMRSAFGRWQDGYIVLNGAWCEPITVDLISAMNHKLVEAKRLLRDPVCDPAQQLHSADDRRMDGCDLDGCDLDGGCQAEEAGE